MRHPSPITGPQSLFASAQGKPVTDIRSALRDAIAQLEREETPSAALAAELLLMHALGRDRAWLYAHPEDELDAATRERYCSLVAQRASGVPTQYLTGQQEFWGLDFEVAPDVLIPRPETEHVIEVALGQLGVEADIRSPRRNAALHIADVGAGSGCIAVALARELPGARIVATDISGKALEVARRNAIRHDVAGRIDFVECNLLDIFLDGSRNEVRESHPLDLIVSNPPYIGQREAATLPREVREHEPEVALFAGETGVEIYAPLIAQAAALLKPNGILVLEVSGNLAQHVSRLLDTPEWGGIAIANDLAGIARVVSALRLA